MTQVAHATIQSAVPKGGTDKLYLENTLLRIAGALFCHDPKRASSRTGQIEINRGVIEKQIVIRPDPLLGQPGPLAHKIFVALIKKHSDYGRPVQGDVSFTKRELMRLAGRKQWGGADSEQLLRAITQIQTTLVSASFRNNDGHFVEERFNIFSTTRIERREFASDPIEACTITLAEPIVRSLQDEHFTCLNHSLIVALNTIGQALYIRLFFHFANRFDGSNGDQLEFVKRYDDICTEWLGGLTIVKHQSKIRDRLGAHLDQLVAHGFLRSYRIAKAKSRSGFVLTFTPGILFFRDYGRFYRTAKPDLPGLDSSADRRETSEPLKVAYLFIEKRTGSPVASGAFIPTKDKETAKQLLAHLPFADMPAFIDYGLAEARRTNFDVQTLGGIKQYLSGYVIFQARQKAARAAQAAFKIKEKAEAERMSYEAYRSKQAIKLFDRLPGAEQSEIEDRARSYAASFSGSLRDRMLASRRIHITLGRYGDQLPSFDQWRNDKAAA